MAVRISQATPTFDGTRRGYGCPNAAYRSVRIDTRSDREVRAQCGPHAHAWAQETATDVAAVRAAPCTPWVAVLRTLAKRALADNDRQAIAVVTEALLAQRQHGGPATLRQALAWRIKALPELQRRKAWEAVAARAKARGWRPPAAFVPPTGTDVKQAVAWATADPAGFAVVQALEPRYRLAAAQAAARHPAAR